MCQIWGVRVLAPPPYLTSMLKLYGSHLMALRDVHIYKIYDTHVLVRFEQPSKSGIEMFKAFQIALHQPH